jgi:hypothetical protein
MGKPTLNGVERYEAIAANEVTVWKSDGIQALIPERPIIIDMGRLFFWRSYLVVKNAR